MYARFGNSQLHASSHSKITAGMSELAWRCRPFTQNARESKPVPATPIGAAVCGLVNINMTLLSVCIGMTTGGFVKGKCYSSFQVGCPKIATRIYACTPFW